MNRLKSIKGMMDIQRASNHMHREKDVDVTVVMDGKLMLHSLRSKPPQGALGRGVPFGGMTGVDAVNRWKVLQKDKGRHE